MDYDFIKYIIGAICGAPLTLFIKWRHNRKQIMKCYYIEEDILAKIPTKNDDGSENANLYVKKFKLKNTTNKDYSEFKVVFQFDIETKVLEHHSKSKNGIDEYPCVRTKYKNECIFTITHFNRNDTVDFTIRLADIDINKNKCLVIEKDCTGFSIKCIDKRKSSPKSKSTFSTALLTENKTDS